MDLSHVIAGWQTKLLQLDRRNSLLYFRGQRGSVNIVDIGPDELLDRLQKSRTGLKFPYAEPHRRGAGPGELDRGTSELLIAGALATDIAPLPLQKRLLNLHRQDREWEEEQGLNVLFVALGFLHWIDDDGEIARSPLLLLPVQLERDSPRDPWRLKPEEDDLQVNETLRHQLSTYGLELPEYEHETPSAYLEEVARRLAHKQDWSVAPELALATFPFVKLAMWEDLDQMRRQGTDHPMIRALGGDLLALRPSRTTSPARIPDDRDLAGGRLDDLLPVKNQFTVVPADHSQLRAIELARSGGHLVIHGPPGTGKSQTIANIIAAFLADGKRVLFVSEKTAALDIVKQRLEDCEMGCFCLDLHSHRARKPSVYQQLRVSLEAPRTASDVFPLARLEEQREQLNVVARALHEIRQPLGQSVFDVQGRFAQLRSLKRVDFPLRRVDDLSADALRAIEQATARIARRQGEFEAHGTSPWRSLRRMAVNLELADDIRQMAGVMRDAVAEFHSRGEAESIWLGLPPPERACDVETVGKIAGHMAACPGILEIWLHQPALDRLDRRAGELAEMQGDRRRLQSELGPCFGDELPDLAFDELKGKLEISLQDRRRLEDALGTEWSERLCPRPDQVERELGLAVDGTRGLREAALRVFAHLGDASRFDDRLAQVRRAAQQVRFALDTPAAPKSWFEPGGFSAARAALAQARGRLAELESAERRLFNDFEENLLEHVSQDMLVRYRTDHQSPWRVFRKSYRADQRALSGCLRSIRKLKLAEALAAVEAALRVRVLRAEWQAASEACSLTFGSRFTGRTTDWQALAALIDQVDSWAQGWEWGQESAQRCNSEDRTSLESLLWDLEAALLQWETSLFASRDAAPDLDLSERQVLLEAAAETVARLVHDGSPLWPHLRCSIPGWGELIEILHQAVRLRRIEACEETLAAALLKDFEGYYDGPDTDWQRIRAALLWTGELLSLVQGRLPAALVAQCRQPRPPEQYTGLKDRLDLTLQAFRLRAADFSTTFDPRQAGWEDWEVPSLERLTSWLDWIGQNADSASAWLEYSSAVRELEGLLAPGVVEALRGATADASQVPDLVLRRIYAAWLAHIYDKDERLRSFTPREHEALRDEFRELDRRFLRANRARVRKQGFQRYPDDHASAIEWGQLGLLRRQLSLKRSQLPVRRLIQQIPQLLQALKPCLLMSPVAVSQFLPRGELATDCLEFDAVVFDEASQVFPHDAVPAIARAKQVIVVGDEKQLPPTSFFRSDYLDEEEAEDELVEDRLQGAESILDVMVGMAGSGVHHSYLGVHYRSRHEDLIRYSNHHFYKDRLLTFPSPDTTGQYLGLEDVYLPDARYDAGASRTNRLEAEAVVQRVFDLLASRPAEESVGVVALSRSQAELIEQLLDARRLVDSSLDWRFAETGTERFFVKNLENVQGDERDHIILSIGYGPTVGSGSVPNRFGPINSLGGERRLNVAVTRARRSLTVIRSLRPEQITVESEGARLLRRFLEYVQDPRRAFEQAIQANPAAESESPFEDSVYQALTQRGHRVARQVGCFGYRIDLAVAAEDGSRYDLGIECDGATYHSAPSARDRDWLRQQVLEGLGWTIHRIWSKDWIQDPEAQIRMVERALEIARTTVRETVRYEAPAAAPEVPESSRAPGHEERPREEFQFVPYEPVALPRRYSSAITDEQPQTLDDLVARIVEAEGPIHIEKVVEQIRRCYGAGRAGSQIQATIEDAANRLVYRGRIAWLKLGPGTGRESPFLGVPKPAGRPEPRGPAKDGSVRDIEHVWPGEIEAGVLRIVEAAFGGVSKEDAIIAAARAFGYARVGSKIRSAIEKVIEGLGGDLPPGGLTS